MQTLLRVGIAACLTLLLSWQGFPQIAKAQFNNCGFGFCTAPMQANCTAPSVDGTPVVSSFATNPSVTAAYTNGDVIVAMLTLNSGGPISFGVPTSTHLTFSVMPGSSDTGVTSHIALFGAIAGSTQASETITADSGGTSGNLGIIAVKGANTSGGTSSFETSTSASTEPLSLTTAFARDVLFAVTEAFDYAGSYDWTQAYTAGTISAAQYKPVAATNTYTITFGGGSPVAIGGVKGAC